LVSRAKVLIANGSRRAIEGEQEKICKILTLPAGSRPHIGVPAVRQCRTRWSPTMTTLTIRLDPKLEKALDRIAKRTGRTKSEIAREALRRQVAIARFRELRSKTLPFAEAQGLVTDEDVFRALS
jgi:predicted transcriptional regulator